MLHAGVWAQEFGRTGTNASTTSTPTNTHTKDCRGAPACSLTLTRTFEKGEPKEQPSGVNLTALVTPIHEKYACPDAPEGNCTTFTPRADIISWKIKTPRPLLIS